MIKIFYSDLAQYKKKTKKSKSAAIYSDVKMKKVYICTLIKKAR